MLNVSANITNSDSADAEPSSAEHPQAEFLKAVLLELFDRSLKSGGAASSKWPSIIGRCVRRSKSKKKSEEKAAETDLAWTKKEKKKRKMKGKKERKGGKGEKDKTTNEDLEKEHAASALGGLAKRTDENFIETMQTYLNASFLPQIERMSADGRQRDYLAIVDKLNVLCETVR